MAICNEHVGVVRQLLVAKADTKIVDDSGQTALAVAREGRSFFENVGYSNCVKKLTEVIELLEGQSA